MVSDSGFATSLRTGHVTAVLPYFGLVDWTSSVLDAQALEWATEHQPVGPAWRLPLFKPNDTRRCSTCPGQVLWEACQYAAWARYWNTSRR